MCYLDQEVANLEQEKVAQALEIIKLKQRVRRLEKKMRTKHSGLKRLKKLGTSQRVEFSIDTIVDDQEDAFKWGGIAELDANEDVTLEDVDDEVKMDANIQGRLAESQAKAYNLDLQHAKKVLSMQDTDEANPAEVEEVLEVVIAARLMTKVVTTAAQVPKASALRKRRGVVIQDPEETAAASIICFWTTTKARTINGEAWIHAKVDGKKVIISEASIRRDLHFGDKEGVDYLLTASIFE
nr:hypothetical protein [Tanacetum cinerariifolium]